MPHAVGVPNLDWAGGDSRHKRMAKSAISLSNQDLTLLQAKEKEVIVWNLKRLRLQKSTRSDLAV